MAWPKSEGQLPEICDVSNIFFEILTISKFFPIAIISLKLRSSHWIALKFVIDSLLKEINYLV